MIQGQKQPIRDDKLPMLRRKEQLIRKELQRKDLTPKQRRFLNNSLMLTLKRIELRTGEPGEPPSPETTDSPPPASA